MRSALNTSSAASASSWNRGGETISGRPVLIRFSQFGQAVVHSFIYWKRPAWAPMARQTGHRHSRPPPASAPSCLPAPPSRPASSQPGQEPCSVFARLGSDTAFISASTRRWLSSPSVASAMNVSSSSSREVVAFELVQHAQGEIAATTDDLLRVRRLARGNGFRHRIGDADFFPLHRLLSGRPRGGSSRWPWPSCGSLLPRRNTIWPDHGSTCRRSCNRFRCPANQWLFSECA